MTLIHQFSVSQLDHGLVPRRSLRIDVVALAVGTTAFVVSMGDVELIAKAEQLGHYVLGGAVVLIEGFNPLVEVRAGFALFYLVEVFPAKTNHHGCVLVDAELDLVGSIEVIQTDIIIVMIVLEDH